MDELQRRNPVMDRPTARMATQKYRKPEVFELGSVHELTCWEKSGGSADAWGQQKQDGHPGTDGGTAGDFSGGH
jgi:hypothetical protein